MPYNDELIFEKDLISHLTSNCGWSDDVIKNPTEADLIDNWKRMLFETNKEKDCLNGCHLTNGEMQQILTNINTLRTPFKLNGFINGKTVSIIRDNPEDSLHFGKTVSLHIFDRQEKAGGKSHYQIAEQPQFTTNNLIYPSRRGDLMLLINGMPLYHIELKRTGIPISQAEIQIEKYMKNNVFTGIFSLVQVFVAMSPEEAVYYANPGPDGKFNSDYYFHWEDFNNEYVNDWKAFASSVLSIPRAHDIIGFYTIADDSDGILKVLRSYQIYAAQAITSKVSRAGWTKSCQRGGYIWHTTGSGKTMTSFKSAQLITNSINSGNNETNKVVFLLDRTELGDQSLIDYRNYSLSESVQETSNTDVLISKLLSSAADDNLIVTSIQKMSRINADGGVNQSVLKRIQEKHIVFIIDECHRDNKGEMHRKIEDTFPKAIFFGFTGTPDLDDDGHSITSDIFGDELHRYTIVHGIRDNNVLGFDPCIECVYDDKSIREKVALSECKCSTKSEAMSDQSKRETFIYYTKDCSMLEIESKIPNSQYETPEYRKCVVENILNDWPIRSVNNEFYAVFATSSISQAIKYYRLFKGYSPSIKIVTVFDPSDMDTDSSIEKMEGITEMLNDYYAMFGKKYDHGSYHAYKKDVCARLAHKRPYERIQAQDQIDLVIVVDQLLTGFDSKWINTLYMDKMLDGKNCIQAVSRTNRLYGPTKRHGAVVFYRRPHTMDNNLRSAVRNYSGENPMSVFVNKLDRNLEAMNLKFASIKNMFETANIPDFSKNHTDTAWRRMFIKTFGELNKCLDSATIQGFRWDCLSYNFLREDGTKKTVTLDFDHVLYLTFVQRYKELCVPKSGGTSDIPFDVDTHIVEIATDTIDDDYINSKFILWKRDITAGDSVVAEKALDELHRSFASLSSEDQAYANQFLVDVEQGKVLISDSKTLRDYITDYKCKAHNDSIKRIASRYGVNEELLRNILSLVSSAHDINEYGRFDKLMSTLDIDKVQKYYNGISTSPLSKRQARIKVENELREYILSGGRDDQIN